ncbi:GntR family transcriptional regulator [Rhizobium leguminosarum bv. trifolii]|uniref:GntR family transcriptional regulator n=2 Tax=Rhizobium TaxID=379 RepID=A0A3E1B6I7_RHILT|nr:MULTISPECIES: GntR family transcriptional regulator [Rhizobium]KPH05164.1 GntR family transcriptional regulator [Rhizobium acidisoli]QAS81102.1 GntR family transcriptional regulator [Rhizobium acidisoli]RFB86501.1 GntR family transcriptional regulator [Rhizobium leguminosarum bv. trifolii]RFB86761.1 GntR family transcriptional regulator [Rhizobium leguminosarum bv. trifolii]
MQTDLQISKQNATLRFKVEETLRQAIVSGRFKPGQRLVERELCEMLGVGRTSVREAMRQLEAEGIITSYPHKGPVVSTITYEEAQQLYTVRALLEGFAGQQFAEHGTAADITTLLAAVVEFEAAAESGVGTRLIHAKNAFYDCLMDGSKNVFVRQMLTALHNRINLLRMTSMTQPGRLSHSIAEIKDIANAIKNRNGPLAAAACKFHIDQAAKVVLEYLRKNAAPES